MATASEQLVIDAQSRFLEMKSLQPYSTTDEYLYAMKEDLAEWLANMYPDWGAISAENFLERLENGALLCHHANNVNAAARKCSTYSTLKDCKFRADARPGSFPARDNASQFIGWARGIVGVREVLMFESDDLIMRKNEKNFILCLLEIARFGAKFGVSVPAIIKLEQEIEQEIERESQRNLRETTESSVHAPKQRLNSQGSENSTSSNDPNSEQASQRRSVIEQGTDPVELEESLVDSLEKTVDSRDASMNTGEDAVDQAVNTAGALEREVLTASEAPEARQKPMVAPPSSSQLHKTVVNIVNSCCCSQRFPVTRLGEGRYRIGENGTIIFIRILRNHVMVRVGGGWDTLENYLNKHDPCRRAGGHHRHSHSRNEPRPSHADIPILAIPKHHHSSSSTPSFGKSVQLKTESYPLAEPTTHDTDLGDAQLLITRGADGRHHIGQITYKAEEAPAVASSTCSHHSSPSSTKTKPVRTSGRSTPLKQPSPSQSASIDCKEDFVTQAMKSLDLSALERRLVQQRTPPRVPIASEPLRRRAPPPKFDLNKANIAESFIGNIDPGAANHFEQDFELNDIAEAMKSRANELDEDSLESSEEVSEDKPKTSTPKRPSAYRSAQQRLPVTNLNRKASRSTTISQVREKERRKPMIVTHRSHSTELLDISKIDRDSGFDEQDFRRERLSSNGDDNSSVSSVRSTRPPSARAGNLEYKETKSSELRMRTLEKRKESARRATGPIVPSPNRSRQNSLTNPTLKLLPQNPKVNL